MADLAEALRAASTDPARRADFYRALLESQVFVITPDAVEGGTLLAGANLRLAHCTIEGRPMLPLFSSLGTLQKWVREQVQFVQMPARALFEMTRGEHLVLDTGQPHGKFFTPEEVAGMLDGSIFAPQSSYQVTKATSVFIGQPAHPPLRLIERARAVFEQHRCIQAAYLVHFHNPEHDKEPHSLIGVDSDGDPAPALAAVGFAINDLSKDEVNGPVDFIRLSDNDFAASIRKYPPFYRPRAGLLKRLFG